MRDVQTNHPLNKCVIRLVQNASSERPEGPAVFIGQAEGLVKPGTRNQRAEGPAVCESSPEIFPNGRTVGPLECLVIATQAFGAEGAFSLG